MVLLHPYSNSSLITFTHNRGGRPRRPVLAYFYLAEIAFHIAANMVVCSKESKTGNRRRLCILTTF